MTVNATDLFESILTPLPGNAGAAQRDQTLRDLALDQTFEQLIDLAPHASLAFRTLLQTVPEVEYRQAIFRGLEHGPLRTAVDSFLEAMTECKNQDARAAKAKYTFQAEFWHLSASSNYVEAVRVFSAALAGAVSQLNFSAQGWELLSGYLEGQCRATDFLSLGRQTKEVQNSFTDLDFNILVRGGKVTVARTDGEEDLVEAVLETFERFQQHKITDPESQPRKQRFDQVQAWILERAALLHPEPFARLQTFAQDTRDYRNKTLDRFTDEVAFYLAYLDFMNPLRNAGLSLSYPQVSDEDKSFSVTDTWDLTLAARMVADEQTVVTNDLHLAGHERILMVSGPNQGGKTTSARLFGQVHHLAAIGCPVPGSQSKVFLCDQVLTAFEREEQLDTLESRLGAEVKNFHDIFDIATSSSVLVINEPFGSTSLQDARILTRDLLGRISDLDALAVCVTFIDELSRFNEKTVSIVSTVEPNSPAVRTFRMERRPADGQAYAHALAAKHGLTSEQIRRRMKDVGGGS